MMPTWQRVHLLAKQAEKVALVGEGVDTNEEEVLGLEEQDESERAKCMRDKQLRPAGLIESHLGVKFPSEISVESLTNTQPLKGATCSGEGGCGLFNLTHPHSAKDAACVREVPKLIHFVWLDHPLPERYAKNIVSVMMMNPDRRFLLWVNDLSTNTSALTEQIKSDFGSDAEVAQKRLLVKRVEDFKDRFMNWDIITQEPNVGARSDWIRLEAVYLYGGIYMDTDVRPVHGFSDYGGVFQWPFVAYSNPKGYGNLCNCIFSAEKRSPFVKLVAEGWREGFFHFNLPSGPPFGCGVLTAAFMTYNNPEIMMLAERYMFSYRPVEGAEPVISMTFDGSWKDKKSEAFIQTLMAFDKPETMMLSEIYKFLGRSTVST